MIVAPYEDRDGWSINVMRVNGVLYFEEHLTDTQLEAKCVSLCVCAFCPVSITPVPQNQSRTPAPPSDVLRLLFRIMVHLFGEAFSGSDTNLGRGCRHSRTMVWSRKNKTWEHTAHPGWRSRLRQREFHWPNRHLSRTKDFPRDSTPQRGRRE